MHVSAYACAETKRITLLQMIQCDNLVGSGLLDVLQAELARNWRIKATVFYDRPPAHFRPATLAEKVRTASCAAPITHIHHPDRVRCAVTKMCQRLLAHCMSESRVMYTSLSMVPEAPINCSHWGHLLTCNPPLQHDLMLRLSPELEAPVHPHDCCAPQQPPASRAAEEETASTAGAAAASGHAAGGADACQVDNGRGGGGGGPAASGQERHGGAPEGFRAGGHRAGRKMLRGAAGDASAAPAAAAAVRAAMHLGWREGARGADCGVQKVMTARSWLVFKVQRDVLYVRPPTSTEVLLVEHGPSSLACRQQRCCGRRSCGNHAVHAAAARRPRGAAADCPALWQSPLS